MALNTIEISDYWLYRSLPRRFWSYDTKQDLRGVTWFLDEIFYIFLIGVDTHAETQLVCVDSVCMPELVKS